MKFRDLELLIIGAAISAVVSWFVARQLDRRFHAI